MVNISVGQKWDRNKSTESGGKTGLPDFRVQIRVQLYG